MRKRGYFGMEDMLPAIPKKITKASVRRLVKITTKDLYDKADFIDLTTGEILGKGTEGRKIERKRSALKAVETRKRRKRDAELIERGREEWERQHPEPEYDSDEEWEQEQRERDRQNRRRMEEEAYRRKFDEGWMIAEQIEELIDSIEVTFSAKMANYAREAWETAKRNTDRNALYKRLSDNPDVIDALKDSYYQNRSGDHFRPTEFKRFVELIQGSPMSAQESQDMQDAYERRQALDPDIDEGIED